MSQIFHFDNISVVYGDIRVDVNLKPYEQRFQNAQFRLDTQVMNDMVLFMPIQTGTLRAVTMSRSIALAGTGKVIAAATPHGRFQYMGKVMVDPETGSPWARPGVKKVVTDRPLTYSSPLATPMWFDTAKERFGPRWIDGVKKQIGGG